MRLFKRKAENKRQVYLSLVSDVEGQLRDAYAKRHEEGETLASISERIGIDRTTLHHRLNGRRNLTLLSIAELVWALGYAIKVSIFDPNTNPTNHAVVRSEHTPKNKAQFQNQGQASGNSADFDFVRGKKVLVG